MNLERYAKTGDKTEFHPAPVKGEVVEVVSPSRKAPGLPLWLRALIAGSVALWIFVVVYDANHDFHYTSTEFWTDTIVVFTPLGIVLAVRWVLTGRLP